MAISASSGKGAVAADINVTPMIDVMLVLLIIFMIVTPLITAGFTATMPSGENAESLAEEDGEVTLGIDNGGNYFVNGNAMTPQAAEEQLRGIFATREEDKRLFFKADQGLPYAKIQEGIEMGRRAGARVLVAVVDRKGLMGGEN
ncbi:MAG: biopolymer transporter ExbD [Gemmatimonadales bacterium]|nr:biopolymer transporter ExbD [Gemmatimonadales bacterium]MDZ4388785.1 biopolymer transporter ExbD [Gemmatimonadales bacterium]